MHLRILLEIKIPGHWHYYSNIQAIVSYPIMCLDKKQGVIHISATRSVIKPPTKQPHHVSISVSGEFGVLQN